MSEYVVELKNITKRFPGVIALKNMSIGIKPGEIHGLIGENGAGKSTLIKVLTGVHIPEEGEIYIDGKKKMLRTPVYAREEGIACVYQELNIVQQLSVTDNIFMGRSEKNSIGLLDYSKMHKEAKVALDSLGHPEINPKSQCGKLGIGLQQMVEIAKAISLDAKLIIMDEPTSSLGKDEIAQLMKTVRTLKDKGIAVLFVSHKLEELFELCDRVTVMRDGEHIITKEITDITNEELIHAMVGRTLDNLFPKEYGEKGEVFLKVENINATGVLRDVSFEAYGGQILGFAGLVGAGRTETMRALFGADHIDSGNIFIKGKKVSIKSPKDAIKNKIAFLTEDRKGQGLVLSEPIKSNLILANMKHFKKGVLLDHKAIEKASNDNIKTLKIKTPSADEVVAQLSGGNQQKVVIGKWMNSDSEIFIFDEPTRGIDVGAKIEVYNVMNTLVKQGKCVIMVSSELPEILAMSDRVVVMRGGRVMGQIDRETENFCQESIMKAAWGGKI
ncbi:sugar ABC transporter ATP-binding protein [Lachnospiraceae bacterium LCP25S3_G4]